MSNTAGPPIPAGWYRDPAGSDQLRWWDGVAWTNNLAPRPVPAPTPVAPTPVVPTPTVGGSPGFTPGLTPVSDPDEQKYVPFQDPWVNKGNTYANAPSRVYGAFDQGAFARPTQWNTAGAWFLATSYLWSFILGIITAIVLVTVVGAQNLYTNGVLNNGGIVDALLITLVIWLLLILAAARDRAALTKRGFLQTASPLWILVPVLTPLAYLIVRTVRVRRESGHGQAPLVFFAVSYVAVITLSIVAAIAIPVFLASRTGSLGTVSDSTNATSLATGITTGLNENGGNFTVTCAPFAEPTTSPIQVSCSAIDMSTDKTHAMIIQINPGANGGKPTFELLSVTPPISNG
jgi:hypothetical protein